MGNNFSSCEKKYNRQLASGFAVYMMGGSLFQKCICANQAEARHLYLHYAEMPAAKQLAAEDAVLAVLRQQDPEWLSAMEQLWCEARFCPQGDSYQIWFDTKGFGRLGLGIDPKGRIRKLAV